jgi:hypothetical protein
LVLVVVAFYLAIFSELPVSLRLFLLMLSLVVVPLSWILIRGKRVGDPEGGLPDPTLSPTSEVELGEFPEAPLFNEYRAIDVLISREWVNPDAVRLRKIWQRRAEEAKRKTQKDEKEASAH